MLPQHPDSRRNRGVGDPSTQHPTSEAQAAPNAPLQSWGKWEQTRSVIPSLLRDEVRADVSPAYTEQTLFSRGYSTPDSEPYGWLW